MLLVSACAEKPPGYALVTAHPLATKAGENILRQGGNAFDVAITVSAVLAVVEPYSSGFGGGGFWLLHRASDKKDIMLDGRERAPGKSRRDMYLDTQENFLPAAALNGPLAAGVPGMPAALVHLAENYGNLPLQETLSPAIKYARKGFPVDEYLLRMLASRLNLLREYPATSSVFLVGRNLPKLGKIITQPDLANTIECLAAEGAQCFYTGKVAKQLVEQVQKNGGIWELSDLATYRVVEREPIQFDYHDAKITSVAPPSSGGVALAEMLNIISQFDMKRMDRGEQIHHLIEAMRLAYHDRAIWLGDTDFVDVPIEKLTSMEYANTLVPLIQSERANKSAKLTKQVGGDGRDTTHFSILDGEGNRVAATLSINYSFGSGFIADGTGILLNNEMDDFAAKSDTPNVYGLVGGDANAIEPGKRMLSSMSPTFIDDGKRIAILGTPGGSRIITMVLLGILDFLQGQPAEKIVAGKRFHHQYLPDVIQYESEALSLGEQTRLRIKGHELKEYQQGFGNMQIVIWDYQNNKIDAASDPRGVGLAVVQ